MAKTLDLKKKVNNLVKKSKANEEGFSYLCDNCDFECQGRKSIIVHIKDDHEEKYVDLKSDFEQTPDKDFQSQLSKLVMNVPFSNKEAKAVVKPPETKKVPEKVASVKKVEVAKEETVAVKDLPLTFDFMKTIDTRTTRIPNYGSLVGRIARLVAMVVKKEVKDEKVKLTCHKCNVDIDEYKDIFNHLEKEHAEFIKHLCSMFPPAKKRMDQFVTKAVENFELIVPTLEYVEKQVKAEKEKEAELRKKEMQEKIEKARKDREEMKKKIEEATKARLALKRKQEEEAKLKEYKIMKIDPTDEKAEEKLRAKKEILRIEKSLKDKSTSDIRKKHLNTKLNELKEKMKKDATERKEKIITKRMETCLENLSPKQLRKLCLEYFNNIDNLEDVNWVDICESVKIGDDYEFLTDFLGSLYEFAKFHGKKSFKVGHILITSKQSDTILEKGIRSIRDFVKKDSWRIPSSWDVDIPGDELGEEWNRKDDSRLLIGASKFGKNLNKIIKSFPTMNDKAVDASGAVSESVKKRFGYLLNIYMSRGEFVEEFGTSLYSVDVEEEDNWDEDAEDEEEDVMVIEDDEKTELGGGEKPKNIEKKEANGTAKESEEKDKVEKKDKVEEIEEDDEIEEVEEMEDVNEEDM